MIEKIEQVGEKPLDVVVLGLNRKHFKVELGQLEQVYLLLSDLTSYLLGHDMGRNELLCPLNGRSLTRMIHHHVHSASYQLLPVPQSILLKKLPQVPLPNLQQHQNLTAINP